VHNAVKLKREMIEAAKVKEDRRRKHSRKGKEKPKAERKSECLVCFSILRPGVGYSRRVAEATPKKGSLAGCPQNSVLPNVLLAWQGCREWQLMAGGAFSTF
jgi:hypothetical protein